MAKVDQLDRAIVDLLIQDGRMSSVSIARRLGNVSARTVSNRIDRLVREDLIKVAAIVNRTAIGYPVVADVFLECEPGKVQAVAESLTRFPEVGYIGIVMGDHDVSIQVNARSVEHLQQLITETIHLIPGVRRSVVYLLAQRLSTGVDWGIPLDVIEGGNPRGRTADSSSGEPFSHKE